MSDQDQAAAGGEGGNGGEAPQTGPMINVHAQYIKDLSFEVPGAPGIFTVLQNAQPDIAINVDVGAKPLQEPAEGKPGLYEVVLDIKAQCKSDDKVAFIIELTYGGVFEVGVPAEHLHPMLLIECPRLLFPFARNIVAEVSRDGGFPPLMVAPIDFVKLFHERVQQQQGGTA